MNRIRHDERYTTHGNSLVERCIELLIWLVEILGLSLVKLSKEGLGYAAHKGTFAATRPSKWKDGYYK